MSGRRKNMGVGEGQIDGARLVGAGQEECYNPLLSG